MPWLRFRKFRRSKSVDPTDEDEEISTYIDEYDAEIQAKAHRKGSRGSRSRMKAPCKATVREIEVPQPMNSPNIFTCATSDEEDSKSTTCDVHPKDNGVGVVVDNGVTQPRKLVLD
ncbi:hypothetical protein ACHWQZ_G000274 [Mnemiopsis leidyi]